MPEWLSALVDDALSRAAVLEADAADVATRRAGWLPPPVVRLPMLISSELGADRGEGVAVEESRVRGLETIEVRMRPSTSRIGSCMAQ